LSIIVSKINIGNTGKPAFNAANKPLLSSNLRSLLNQKSEILDIILYYFKNNKQNNQMFHVLS
jgi:hypothetical protein